MADRIPRIELTDDVLFQMMQNPQITQRFPFLGTAMLRSSPAKAKGCASPCGRKKTRIPTDMATLRKQVADLPLSEKSAMKQLLNTQQIVVRYTQPSGKPFKLMF